MKKIEILPRSATALTLLLSFGLASAAAQEPEEEPRQPQQEVLDAAEAPDPENVVLPGGRTAAERNRRRAEATAGTILPQAFNATDWFVQNTLGVGTDAPIGDIEIRKSTAPFLVITGVGAVDSGINPWNTNADNYVYTDSSGDLRVWTDDFGTEFGDRLSIETNGNVGIGTTTALRRLHVGPGSLSPVTAGGSLLLQEGTATSMIMKSTTGAESFFYQDAVNGLFGTASSTPMGIRTNNLNRVWITESGNVGINTTSPAATLHVVGNQIVTGTKSFAQDHPTDPAKQIVYAALEGGEAGTYTRGTATLVDGEATVELPEHFALVTEESGLTVQLTPRGEWLQLFVAELTPRKLSVKEPGRRAGRFDFLVQGVRKGYGDYRVVRERVSTN